MVEVLQGQEDCYRLAGVHICYKFLSAIAILKTEGKKESTFGINENLSKSLAMPDKVKLL